MPATTKAEIVAAVAAIQAKIAKGNGMGWRPGFETHVVQTTQASVKTDVDALATLAANLA